MRSVRIEWEGPLSLDEVKELADGDEDCGLYQIYGRHIIFGDDSLLYIGMTTSTFRSRFFSGREPHIEWWRYCPSQRGLRRRRGCRFMLVGLWRKIISMIRHIGRIGRMFSKMLRHLQSTGTRRRTIHRTLKPTMVSDSKL